MGNELPIRSGRGVWLGSLLWPKLKGGHVTRGQLAGRLIFGAIGLLIALLIYGASLWFLRLCYGVELIGPLLCRRLLDVVLVVLLSVLLLSNIITALSSYFLAQDLELLVAAPVPPRTLFGARLLEQLWHSSWMVVVFGLPVLLAFVHVAGTNRSYGALLLTLPPLLMLPATIGVALTLALVSSLPAARARELIVALVFVAFVVFYVALRLLRPERMINPEGFASLVSFLASFSTPSGSWLPSHWATVVIGSTFSDATGTGDAGVRLAALWTAAGSSHVVASWLFRRVYAEAYSRSQHGRNVAHLSRLWARLKGATPPSAGGTLRTPDRIGARADWLRLFGALRPHGAPREFLIKDLKLLLRDPSQWSQLVLLGALVFVYLYNFRYFRQIGDSGLIGRFALFMVGLALSGFVTTAVSVRFAYPLISMEGRMLWLLYSAPLARQQIIRSKLASTLPALLLVAEVLAIASSWILGVDGRMVALSGAVAGLTAIAVAALSMGIGALFPDFRAESAAKVAASFGGLICMTLAMTVAFVLLACAGYPAWVLYSGRAARWWLLGLSAGAALLTTALAVWLPLRLGARALDRHEP